jgi:hypothetical protein
MQAGGGLVEHVERVAALRALQLGGQLDALRLAARQLGGRLAQPQVAQADGAQQAQRALDRGSASKKACASSTVRPSTSAMVLPRSVTFSVCGLKREPWQVGHGAYTLGMNSSSTLTKPSPSQAGQRPLATLNEKRPAS